MEKFNKVQTLVNKYEQQQLLNFYHDLSTEEKSQLLNEIEGLDFPHLRGIIFKNVCLN